MEHVGRFTALVLLLIPTVAAYAADAHVHGIATLQVAVDGERLVLDFSSPLDNLVGFEHAPRNDRQKDAVRRMAGRLHKAEALFVPTHDAGCTRSAVEVTSPVLDPGLLAGEGPASTTKPAPSTREPAKPPGKSKKEKEHAELEARIVFRCERPEKLSGLEVKLFDAFPEVKRLDVQIAGGKKQTAAKLSSRNRRVSW